MTAPNPMRTTTYPTVIAMLVNVPRYPAAATYTLTRHDGAEPHVLGVASAAHVRALAGTGR